MREVAQAVDVLQIPAFLCRQTTARGGWPPRQVVKSRGPVLAPWTGERGPQDHRGANPISVTERASRSVTTAGGGHAACRSWRAPRRACDFRRPHSVQQRAARATSRRLARIRPRTGAPAVAVGVAGVHRNPSDPDHAPSDGPKMCRCAISKDWSPLMAFDALAKRAADAIGAGQRPTTSVFLGIYVIALSIFPQLVGARARSRAAASRRRFQLPSPLRQVRRRSLHLAIISRIGRCR